MPFIARWMVASSSARSSGIADGCSMFVMGASRGILSGIGGRFNRSQHRPADRSLGIGIELLGRHLVVLGEDRNATPVEDELNDAPLAVDVGGGSMAGTCACRLGIRS